MATDNGSRTVNTFADIGTTEWDDLRGRIDDSEVQIRQIMMENGFGSSASAITASYLGFNHRGVGDPSPINTDNIGMTFFTRPRLNLSYDNIIAERMFTPMLSKDDKCIARILRAYLDFDGAEAGHYTSPLVDPRSAFINILTNKLVSVSGWPDPMMDVYTTKTGRMREELSMADGFYRIMDAHDIDCTFRNIVGDPIGNLFAFWCMYQSLVKEGFIDPRPEYMIENEMDYNTRIWRIILDPGRRFVQRIGCCGAAFPTADSSGAAFNFNEDRVFNTDLDQLSVRFRIMGAIYRDPKLVYEFNDTVILHNPQMADTQRTQHYIKINGPYQDVFNKYQSYPRIDPDTMELEWWVTKALFSLLLNVR